MLDEITFTKPKLVSKVSLNRKFRISFFDKEEYKHCWGSVSTQIFKQFAEDIEGNKAVRTNKLREAWLYSVSNIQSNSSTKKSINYLYDYIELRLLNSIHRKNVENKNVNAKSFATLQVTF